MNPQSVYYMWEDKEMRRYISGVIESVIGECDNYELLDTFNSETSNLKSYVFFESEKRIVHFVFNDENSVEKGITSIDMFNFIKALNTKEIIFIVFNTLETKNTIEGGIYVLAPNQNNDDRVNLMLSDNYKKQTKYDNFGVIHFLYGLDDEFYEKYLREENLK